MHCLSLALTKSNNIFVWKVVNTVQLERLFPQTKDLPLEVVEGLLGALLTIRNPAEPRRTNATAGGSTSNSSGAPDRSSGISSGGGGVGEMDGMAVTAAAAAAAASFEAHAVLALELASRVVLANRHRIARLWPALHSFLARCGSRHGVKGPRVFETTLEAMTRLFSSVWIPR